MVVGVLGVLGILSMAFVTVSQLERRASQQRMHACKALLLARSGLEDALARIGAGQSAEAVDTRYGGEDWLGDGDQGPASFDRQQEAFRPGSLDTEACPAVQAMRPSFFARDALGRPALVAADGRLRGYTGTPGADPSAGTYSLKTSCQAGFWLNGGDPALAAAEGYNAVLRRILGTLAEAIDREDGANDGFPVDEGDGWALVDRRPPSGWQRWEEVRDLALGASQARLEALKPYLTLAAWVDRKVIRPNATADLEGKTFLSWADLRTGRSAEFNDEGALEGMGSPVRSTPDFERLPLAGGRVVGRAPVSLAWARSRRPVLIALLSGLKGLYLDETTACNVNYSQAQGLEDAIGTLRAAEIPNTWGAADVCHTVAQKILLYTGDLSTWDQWNAFCDTLPLTGSPDLKQARRDILKANFNPNSDLNKFNPNPSLLRTVDKMDLLVYSTEFSLLPAVDLVQEVGSVGRLTGRDGRVLAVRALSMRLAGPSVLRLTTQREFACEDLGDPDLAGDEGPPRLPGQAGGPFLSASTGLGKTWGCRLGRPGLGDLGASLQSYPEPCIDSGAGLTQNPADYDGNLQLATVETQLGYYYGVSAPVKDLKMLAGNTTSMDLDVHDGPRGDLQADAEQAAGAELANRLFPPDLSTYKVGTLYPDGCYAERGRTPSYFDRGNADGFHGVLSFWIKPNYKSIPGPEAIYPRVRGRCYVHWSNLLGSVRSYMSPDQQFDICNAVDYSFTLFGAPRADQRRFAFFFESGHENSDIGEHQFKTPMLNTDFHPRVWTLFTCFWDFRSPTSNNGARLLIYAGAPAAINLANNDTYGMGVDPTGAADITADENGSPHRIYLGLTAERVALGQDLDGRSGSGADATFDEFAIYDFGGAGVNGSPAADQASLDSAQALASGRYEEGRYYKGGAYGRLGDPPAGLSQDAAGYFSPLLRLPSGSRIQRVAWTCYRPLLLPDDYVEIELTGPSGAQYLDGTPGGAAGTRSTLAPAWSKDRQRWDAGCVASGPLRAHVVFRRVTGSATVTANTPILDSPVFDDLTLVYGPASGPRVMGWGVWE